MRRKALQDALTKRVFTFLGDMRRAKGSGKRLSKTAKASQAGACSNAAEAETPDNKNSGIKAAGKPVVMEDLRSEIRSLVETQSRKIVAGLIEEAKHGHCTQAKYLFELIGLYPAKPGEEQVGGDTMASKLLKRLGVQENAAGDENSTEEERELAGAVK